MKNKKRHDAEERILMLWSSFFIIVIASDVCLMGCESLMWGITFLFFAMISIFGMTLVDLHQKRGVERCMFCITIIIIVMKILNL